MSRRLLTMTSRPGGRPHIAMTALAAALALAGCVAAPNPAYESSGAGSESNVAEAEAGSGPVSGAVPPAETTARPPTPPSADSGTSRGDASTSRGDASTGSDTAPGELPAICGDGIKHPDERCDAGQLDGWDCTDFGFGGGDLACDLSTCSEFELTACVTCGALDGGVATSCLGRFCESDDDCVVETGEQCCTAKQCANTCMRPCLIDDCTDPMMGCEHGYCLFPCDDDADCEPWFGYTCQHNMQYCENDTPD